MTTSDPPDQAQLADRCEQAADACRRAATLPEPQLREFVAQLADRYAAVAAETRGAGQ